MLVALGLTMVAAFMVVIMTKRATPIVALTSVPFVLVIHPSVPAKTLKEFVAIEKSRPGKMTLANAGVNLLGLARCRRQTRISVWPEQRYGERFRSARHRARFRPFATRHLGPAPGVLAAAALAGVALRLLAHAVRPHAVAGHRARALRARPRALSHRRLERRYAGLTTQGTYRLTARSDVGVTYTLSRAWGNYNGETVAGGPSAPDQLSYPEYRRADWNYPVGDLQIDQRHRARFWINYGVPKVDGLTVSLLQTIDSGVPFGANNIVNTNTANGVDPSPYLANPGYATPPDGSVMYYNYPVNCATVPADPAYLRDSCRGGARRDAFRLEGQVRSDLGLNYSRRVPIGGRRIEFFGQAHVVNLFNQFQICGCGGTVFQNGGTVTQTRVDQTVRNAVSNAALYQPFNPFATTPVQGTNWEYGPRFGQPLNRLAYTTPRQVRVSFGVRF